MTGGLRLTPARLDVVPAEVRSLSPAELRAALSGGWCAGAGNDDWYPPGEAASGAARAYARAVCRGCPVRVECLELAVRTGEPYGIWGGLVPADRRRVRESRRRRAPAPDGGAGQLARSA